MIDTDTTELAAEAATEDEGLCAGCGAPCAVDVCADCYDRGCRVARPARESAAERYDRQRRERHADLMSGLEALTDLLADVGPTGDLLDDYTSVELRSCLGKHDGSIEENMRRLVSLARSLDTEVFAHADAEDRLHVRVEHKLSPAVRVEAFSVIARADAEEAKAALAAAQTAERVTVDYRVEHDETTAREVTAAFARHGVDVRADIADTDHEHPTVDAGPVDVFVDLGEFGAGLPLLADCVSVDAYAATIAAYVRGDFVDFDDLPCPLRATATQRGIHSDGRVITEYIAEGCAHAHTDARAEHNGFTVVRLDNADIPVGTVCGHRVEMAGAR